MILERLTILQKFIDLIFPVECFGCQAEGQWLCHNCAPALNTNKNSCWHCGQKSTGFSSCQTCQQQTGLDGLIFVATYNQTVLKELIRSYKFQYLENLAESLAKLLSQQLQKLEDQLDYQQYTLVPVPLHKQRLKERGFNQSAVLVDKLQMLLDLSSANKLLSRSRSTKQQARLTREERLENTQDAFKARGQAPDKVIIVDDVVSTGATMISCAQALRQAGAQNIWGLALAHNPACHN